MMLLNVLLPICGWTLAIEAQSNVKYPERIYFVESEQQTIKHVPEAELGEGREPIPLNQQNNDRFNNLINRNKPQDNYMQSTNINFNSFLNSSGGPSVPPLLNHGIPRPIYRPKQEEIDLIFNQNPYNPNLNNPNNFNPINAVRPNPNSPNQINSNPNSPNLFNPNLNIPSRNNPNLMNPNFNTPNLNNPGINNPSLNNLGFNNPGNQFINKPNVNDIIGQADENTEIPSTHRSAPLKFNNMSYAFTNFGINLLKFTDPRTKNAVLSPYSIMTMLALLQQGSLGAAQRQISEALGLTAEDSRQVYKMITEDIQKRSSRNILKVANNIYVSDTFDLSPAFKATAVRDFGSEVTPMQFDRSQYAVRKINGWVARKTNDKITDLLGPEAVNQNTQMVLLNALYFKGLWQVRFKPEATVQRDFRLLNGATKVVSFMRMRRVFRSGFDPSNNAQIVILPFEDEQYSLMLILPSEKSTLNSLTNSLSSAQLADYHKMHPKEVDLEIPKFSVRADTELTDVLQRMGITHIFGDRPDLSGIGTHRSTSPQVSAAIHTGMLAVDEDGGTAAAATAFAVVALSYDEPSIIFKANRPFLSILWDNQLVLPLFMAKVEDPNL